MKEYDYAHQLNREVRIPLEMSEKDVELRLKLSGVFNETPAKQDAPQRGAA